jgi:guanylate kinase
MKTKEHVVFLLIGRTGSGKSSLIKKICELTNSTQLLSFATRPQRNAEDVDHIFVTEEDYLKEKELGNIIAETEIAGYHYYATREQLYKADFYTIDAIGEKMLRHMNLPGIKLVTIYISCPEKIREQRVAKRGDDKQVYRKRNLDERSQFRNFVADERWDYSIKNISFANSVSVLKWICNVEGLFLNHTEEDDGDVDLCRY